MPFTIRNLCAVKITLLAADRPLHDAASHTFVWTNIASGDANAFGSILTRLSPDGASVGGWLGCLGSGTVSRCEERPQRP